MTLRGPATRLTVVVGESDQVGHHPLYTEIVHRAHTAGLAGASVFRGVEDFGRSNHIPTTRLLSLREDLPIAVVIVDTEERIRAFFPSLRTSTSRGWSCWSPSRSYAEAPLPDRGCHRTPEFAPGWWAQRRRQHRSTE